MKTTSRYTRLWHALEVTVFKVFSVNVSSSEFYFWKKWNLYRELD